MTETIYAPTQSRIEFKFDASVHLLVMYDYGARCEGETSIGELAPSRLRNFANKLTFAPAGHTYREWHEPCTPTCITYLYLDPIRLQQRAEADVAYAPRLFVEDPVLWETATKLRSVINSRGPERGRYSEALANVLAHELFRSGTTPFRKHKRVGAVSLAGKCVRSRATSRNIWKSRHRLFRWLVSLGSASTISVAPSSNPLEFPRINTMCSDASSAQRSCWRIERIR